MNIVVLAGGSAQREMFPSRQEAWWLRHSKRTATKLYYWMYLWDIVTGRRT